jgi:hypothetical protein
MKEPDLLASTRRNVCSVSAVEGELWKEAVRKIARVVVRILQIPGT